jgi:hypothetical protein
LRLAASAASGVTGTMGLLDAGLAGFAEKV